ncbi:MAG: autotransporter domain-containing protein [Planctomycetaceae bacterium]|nr:autotransporter domain-containing protein [Planctomycetaceae bacterium]
MEFKDTVDSGLLLLGWGSGTTVFQKKVTLNKGDEALPTHSLLIGNRGNTIFNGEVDTTAANANGSGGIAITMITKLHENTPVDTSTGRPIDTSTTIFNNAVNAGTASIDIGFNTILDTQLRSEGFNEGVDANGRVHVVLGSNAGTKGSLSAASINLNSNGYLELRTDASITGKTTFGYGSTLDVGLNTLSITGDALFETGSTYAATLGSSKNSLVNVSGTATIQDGARLVLKGVDPSKAAEQTIFSSTNEIKGTGFSNSLYEIKLAADRKSLEIRERKDADAFVENILGSGGMNRNFTSAAGVANQVMTEGGQLGIKMSDALQEAASIADTNPALAKVAFSQLFGEHGVTGTAASQATAQSFSSSIGNHQTQLRDNSQASTSRGSPAAYASLRTIRQGYSSFDPNRVWAGGFGAWTRQDDKDGQYGYKYNSGGVILGYDREVGDFVFGITTAYSNGEIQNNEGFTNTDVDTFNVGLYGSYNHCSGFFVDGNVGIGYSWNKSKTTDVIAGGHKEGKYRNNSFQIGGNVGYALSLPMKFRIIPSVGVQYTHVHQKGWQERIQSPSQISNWFDKSNNDYVSIPVAVRINKTFRLGGDITITPEVRGAWIYEAKDPQAHVRMGYVGSSASTTLYGIDSGRSKGLVGAGLKAKFNRRLDGFVDYNFEFRSGYKNHNVMAGFGVSF